ncbi:MAG: tripartite tricarboxylate transporter substrate binding protein [Pseudomonadota bacterium]
MNKLFTTALAGTCGAMLFASAAIAEYPGDQTVRIIIPFPPGGTTDTVFRTVQPYFQEALGQDIVIVNMKGAGGAVGTQAAIDASPDGYTLGTLQTNTMIAQAVGLGDYQDEDYVPAVSIGFMPLAITVKGDSPIQNLQEFKDAAEGSPGEVGIAMGVGTLAHFVAQMTENTLGVDLELINAGGGAQKKAAVLGGHATSMIDPPPGVIGLHESGDARILAVFGPERVGPLPDVPTASEQGVELNAFQMKGFFVPKGTPDEVIQTLGDALCSLGDNEELQGKLAALAVSWRCEIGTEYAEWVDETRADVNALAGQMGY